jgi:hypothetical protein
MFYWAKGAKPRRHERESRGRLKRAAPGVKGTAPRGGGGEQAQSNGRAVGLIDEKVIYIVYISEALGF